MTKDERTEAEAMWELIRVLDVRNKKLEERVIYLERKLDTSRPTFHTQDLMELIWKLEGRIIALELSLDRSRDPNPPDGWYFDY